MKHIFITTFTILFILVSLSSRAQNNCPKDDCIPPVDFNLVLSGTFGELRSNHFHLGIDIKTQGVSEKALRAVPNGFVSRVAVSPGGFGRAIDRPSQWISLRLWSLAEFHRRS